ncbi:MAG: ATP-binding protein [Bacteroidales bacterium]|nr:ATP-binding protein [Bacteroidales bacterium]
MNFKRQVFNSLLEWKSDEGRKPLVLRGARQVGKTTIIKDFAQLYKYKIFLNLEKADDFAFFERYSDVKTLVDALLLKNNIRFVDISDTILFIDEIQESPEAISILRYFYEDFPQLSVIAAGSLLEHAMRKVKSFPVGRITYLYLHPLNFPEFLKAIGQTRLLDKLNEIPISKTAHPLLIEAFNKYAIVGGMPEVVKNYIVKDNMADLAPVYESIWETYKNDIEKYASGETNANVIKHIVNVAHLFFDDRIKFQNFGNSNYRSREVGEAFRSLDAAKIIQLIYPTTALNSPIIPDLKKSPRLQFLDIGILNNELGIQEELLAIDDLNALYKGALIPQIIFQELLSLNQTTYKKPSFWVREKTQASAEVDIVLTHKNMIIPIEIKSGTTGSLKSLHQFVDRAEHNYAVRIYAGEFRIDKSVTPSGKPYLLMNIPYYLGTMLKNYISYFVKNYQI